MPLITVLVVGNALATIGASTLWGIGVHQLSQFYFKNASSSRPLKALVGWLGIWETVRQLFTITQVVSSVDQPPLWDNFTVSSPCLVFGDTALYISSALVAIPAQGYFVYRTWEFAERPWIIPYLAAPMLFFQLVFPIALIPTHTINAGSACPHIFGKDVGLSLLVATFSVGAALDVLTCIALTALLWNEYMHRSKVLQSTSSMLLRLMILSVNTGMWTAILAILLLSILHYTTKQNIQPLLGYYHLLSPLYFLTVLINLNVRGYIRDATNNRGLSNVQLSLYLQTMSSDSASTFNARDSTRTGLPAYNLGYMFKDLDMPMDLFGPLHTESVLEN